jgi:hypothetical protein
MTTHPPIPSRDYRAERAERKAFVATTLHAGPENWWNGLSEAARAYWLSRCSSPADAWSEWVSLADSQARLARLIRRLAELPDDATFPSPFPSAPAPHA